MAVDPKKKNRIMVNALLSGMERLFSCKIKHQISNFQFQRNIQL